MKKPELLKISQVAEYLGASEKTIRRRIADGTIKRIKEGGRVLVLECDLEAYIQRLAEEGSRA